MHDLSCALRGNPGEQRYGGPHSSSCTFALTPLGMFYADAVVSTLAQGRAPSAGSGVHTADLLKESPQADRYISMG